MDDRKNLSWEAYVAVVAALALVVAGYFAYQKYIVPLSDIKPLPAENTSPTPPAQSAGQINLDSGYSGAPGALR